MEICHKIYFGLMKTNPSKFANVFADCWWQKQILANYLAMNFFMEFHSIVICCSILKAAGVANYRPIFGQKVTTKIGVEITNFSLAPPSPFTHSSLSLFLEGERKKYVLFLELFNGAGHIFSIKFWMKMEGG